MMNRLWPALGAGALTMVLLGSAAPSLAEHNPLRGASLALGPEADRLIVGFRATPDNVVLKTIRRPRRGPAIETSQARTRASDLTELADRVHVSMVRGRQLTPSMHVMQLQRTLYGAEVESALAALRADPAVKFAEVDHRRYPHGLPDDPLFAPSANAGGQWFMLTPSASGDAAATDTVSAWNITQGSSGTVIADVDTGVLFDHPDLLRAGFGGRLLPGYDFVSEDLNATTGAALGTYLIANDGDGWDPDPTDPGDWINAADQTNSLFPSSRCPTADSSWHGTRVMGILGALTNNSVGVAGMTWNSYLLPVRALGKCGGYDSDIITGMQWAAGLSITGVPDNPYPADIVNLSLGGTGTCPTSYTDVIATLSGLGVLIVASAGNESGPVDAPANCPGVLGVAGLRNAGTKVGYSSLGPEVAVGAPAGNCVNGVGLPCLKSIDTTTNTGLTIPSAAAYTRETNPNLGTSFSAPIVTGIAALMRAVNANLTPAQLIARIEASASPFPQPAGIPVCPNVDPTTNTGECACPNDHSQCGYGMANALSAVMAAQRPIAAIRVPAGTGAGTPVVLDATGSAAACGRTVASFAWTASGGVTLISGASTPKVTVLTSGTGSVTLNVTDSASAIDTAVLSVGATGTITAPAATPPSAGTVAGACPGTLTISPSAPTVTESFAPASVAPNGVSTLMITLANSNGFALTQSDLTETLPGNLTLAATSGSTHAPATSCSGAGAALMSTPSSVTLSNAAIPANGSCTITLSVQGATPGAYTNTIAASALTTGPAGANTAGADAVLTVSAPSHGGGGKVDGWDMLLVIGVLLAGRRRPKRRPPH